METTKEINVAQPAAPNGDVIEQTIAKAVEKDVGSEGMESQQTSTQDDIELEETSIGVDQGVQTTHSALTDYTDVSATRIVKSKVTAIDVLDKNFVFPPDYFRVVERSYPILNRTIVSDAPNQYPLRLDIANALLGRQAIVSKLVYAKYIRYNLEVQLKVLATNFHYGQLMVVWRPSYAPYMPCYITPNGKDLRVDLKSSANFYGSMVPGASPYDNVYTASQLPHHILPITAGANITIKCPWTLNRQYVQTDIMMNSVNHIGFLDIYYLTPIAPTDIDPPRLQVYARFTDIVGFGYKAPLDICSDSGDFIYRRYYMNNGNPYSDNRVIVQFPSLFNWLAQQSVALSSGSDTWNLSDWNDSLEDWKGTEPWWFDDGNPRDKPGFFQRVLVKGEKVQNEKEKDKDKDKSKESKEEAQSGEIEAQTKGGALYSMFNNTLSTANTVAAWVGDALAYFGLSKPPMKGVPQRFVHLAPPMSNAVGPDFSVSNGVNPESLVVNARSDHSEMTEISKMAATLVYYGWGTISTNSRALEGWLYPGYRIWPGNISVRFPTGYRTPTSMLLEKFCLWRGNLKYRFHFSCSSFVSARIAVTVRYENGNSDEAIGMVPTQILEIKGDSTIEGEVPYLCPSPWLPATSAFAYVKVELLDTPVTWKASVAQPIYVTAWFGYPGFQVAMPYDRRHIGIPWAICDKGHTKPNITPLKSQRALVDEDSEVEDATEEQAQSGKLPGVSDCKDNKNYGMNDIFTSLYHLAKRYNPVFGRVIAPFKPYVMFEVADTNFNSPFSCYLITMQPSNSHFASCFRWVRGSYCLLNNGSYQMVDMLDPLYTYHTTDVGEMAACLANKGPQDYGRSLYLFSVVNNHMNRCGQSLIASRSPFHSNYPFVSGPGLRITASKTPSGMKWTSLVDYAGEMTNVTVSDGLAQNNTRMPYLELAYGDDICYNQWMGCPMGCTVLNVAQAYFPTLNRAHLSQDNGAWFPTFKTKVEPVVVKKEHDDAPKTQSSS